MLKYLTKFAMEIIPSVVATIIGAYIVNHYINARPDSPPSTVASMASAAYAKLTGSKSDAPKSSNKGIDGAKLEAKADTKPDAKPDAKPAETSAEMSSIPAPGIKAKGVSEKSLVDKAAEKAVEVKPTETASLPADTPAPRHPVSPREKLIARGTPTEAPAAQPEDRRDAAELARAAIERLRASEGAGKASAEKTPGEKSSADVARGAGETPRIVTVAPQVSPVRPLPPPVTVSAPPAEQGFAMPSAASPSYTGSVQPDGRPTPPAEIPARQLRPLDLRADKADPSIKDQMSSVAQDMMSAAKSVFHSVLPK
jgi:hypothetical protein